MKPALKHSPEHSAPDPLAVSRFRLRLHLSPKGRPSARESGTPYFPPETAKVSRPAPRDVDQRAEFFLRLNDRQHAPLVRPLPARRALILDSIITWGTIAAVVWWLWLR